MASRPLERLGTPARPVQVPALPPLSGALEAATSEAEMTAAAQALADQDPAALRAWVVAHQPDGHPWVRAAADVLNARLAADHPEAAVGWVLNQVCTNWRAAYALQAANTINSSRPELTLKLLPEIADGPCRQSVASALWADLAHTAPQRGRELALAQTDPLIRGEAVSTLVVNWAWADPASAVDLINEAQLTPEQTDLCVALVARALAVTNARQAAAWVDSLEPRLQSPLVLRTVGGLFQEQDAPRAQAWLERYASRREP